MLSSLCPLCNPIEPLSNPAYSCRLPAGRVTAKLIGHGCTPAAGQRARGPHQRPRSRARRRSDRSAIRHSCRQHDAGITRTGGRRRRECRAPDLILLTGDYVCWRRHEAEMLEAQLAGLRAKRVLAVLGNHDYFTWGSGVASALRKNGYEVLRNTTTFADVNGAPMALVGVDDPVTRHDDLDASFKGARGTKIVLCHAPDHAPHLAERGADLVLSGHTHGGQIYFPGITDRLMKKNRFELSPRVLPARRHDALRDAGCRILRCHATTRRRDDRGSRVLTLRAA